MNKTKVLIVDDSAIIRKILRTIISSDPTMEVIGAAPDPYVARDMILQQKPDVMTLDIEMPRMDGIAFLEKIMQHQPIPTIIISSLSKKGSEMALRAFEAGAIDVIEKPSLDVKSVMADNGRTILNHIKQVARVKVFPLKNIKPSNSVSRLGSSALGQTTHQVIAIASSTGGTETLKSVLSPLPADIPGMMIVQHMPPKFTRTYADSLNAVCAFNVKEAEEGDTVLPGQALIAPGNFHMTMYRSGGFYKIRLNQEPPLHGVRPAADLLMHSVAKYAGSNSIGVVLTGMGRDGAQGLLAMKKAGSFNIAQDEKTCVVFGMPREAIEAGAIDAVLPMEQIAPELHKAIKNRAVA